MRPTGAKTWVEVNANALKANAATLRRAIGDAALMAVVKSNAYGHGLIETVECLDSRTDWFGVDSIDEARTVREHSRKPVLILGHTVPENFSEAVRSGFRMTVYDRTALAAIAKAAGKRDAFLHLKIETGTSRQGILPENIPAFVRAAKRHPNLVIEGASTHYADVENVDDRAYATAQLRRFVDALDLLRTFGIRPKHIHTACSAAALLLPETVFTMARAGIALYGLWPSPGVERLGTAERIRLRPALTWKTVIAQVKRLPKGTPVSYGLTERLRKNSVVAILPIGYWDGFDRGLSSVGEVLVRGKRAKVLGRVCMNMCVIDVTGIPGVRTGTEVTLLGGVGESRVSAEEIAEKLGTINYEAVTRINPRIPRIVVE
jgi:alanine racemase